MGKDSLDLFGGSKPPRFPLREAPAALEFAEARGVFGKVVIVP